MILMKRSLVYCAGLFIMALGVSCSVWSNLGVSPMSAIPYVLNRIMPGISMGTFTSALFCCYILLQAILLGRSFHVFRLFQIVGTFLFGWFVDCTNRILSAVVAAPHSYPLQLCFLSLGVVCVAIGIFFYITPGMPMLPGEGVMQVISEKYRIPLHWAKIGFDDTATAVALILCLSFFHQLNGIREGTVLAALGVGKCLGLFRQLWQKHLNGFVELECA